MRHQIRNYKRAIIKRGSDGTPLLFMQWLRTDRNLENPLKVVYRTWKRATWREYPDFTNWEEPEIMHTTFVKKLSEKEFQSLRKKFAYEHEQVKNAHKQRLSGVFEYWGEFTPEEQARLKLKYGKALREGEEYEPDEDSLNEEGNE